MSKKNTSVFVLAAIVAAAVFGILFSVYRLSPALLSPLLSGDADVEPVSVSPITVVIAADPHYIAPELTDGGPYFRTVIENGDGKYMEGCEDITDSFVNAVLAAVPDAVVVAGDLTLNGAAASHWAFAEKLGKIRAAGIPVFVLPGNHDVNNLTAAKYQGDSSVRADTVTGQEWMDIYDDFGYGTAMAQDTETLSYIAELSPTLRLLMIDGSTGRVGRETVKWVERELGNAQNAGARVLACSHQPLLQHSLLSSGFMLEGAEDLLRLYEKYDVICNLCGHMHIQHAAASENGFPEIVTGALVTWPDPYGMLTLSGREGEYQTVRAVESEAAYDFLWSTTFRQVMEELSGIALPESSLPPSAGSETEAEEVPDAEDSGADEQKRSLASYLADANAAYIAGDAGTIDWSDPRFEAWQTIPSLYTYYIQAIALEAGADYHDIAFAF